jgi:hypothetical protein
MAKLILENLTAEQAETLADWFDGQGEQDCCIWFEDRGVKSPNVDRKKTLPNGDVVLSCK